MKDGRRFSSARLPATQAVGRDYEGSQFSVFYATDLSVRLFAQPESFVGEIAGDDERDHAQPVRHDPSFKDSVPSKDNSQEMKDGDDKKDRSGRFEIGSLGHSGDRLQPHSVHCQSKPVPVPSRCPLVGWNKLSANESSE